MISRYFTFLYNECKHLPAAQINSAQINKFIYSPEGQKGYRTFCAAHNFKQEKQTIKSVGRVLTGLNL